MGDILSNIYWTKNIKKNSMIKSIAFYLPQYHPCEENNNWWGKGFTEWTNVVKAKPLFRGHNQPNIPSELGFYDLRLPEVRSEQAELAKQAGVTAFCYWHYWFGNGKRLLEGPFNEVLKSGNPDFPFCLAWANHSWYAKTWDKKGTKKLLIEQTYPGKEDFIAHFKELLPAFKDCRYLKYGNKPIFVVFKPLEIEYNFVELWNTLAQENGFDGIYFIGQCSAAEKDSVLAKGYNAINREEIHAIYARHNITFRAVKRLISRLLRIPLRYNYSNAMKASLDNVDKDECVYPTICPNWDHTPRSGINGVVYTNSNPKAFSNHVKEVYNYIKDKKEENMIVFIKSWNEWGEGNYMEPDLRYGRQYIEVYRKCVDAFNGVEMK